MADEKAPTLHLPKRFTYRKLDFWPEGGLIHLEDRDTGEYIVMTRRDALLRIKAINETIHYWPHASEREELHKLVVNMIEAVKEAKRQGDPTNPEVRRQLIRELGKKRKARLFLPGGRVPGLEIPNLTGRGLEGSVEEISLVENIRNYRPVQPGEEVS